MVKKKRKRKQRKTLKRKKRLKKRIEASGERADRKQVKEFSKKIKKARQEIGKIIVGQEKVVDGLLHALICNGHVIIEGVPGTAKTLLIRALSRVSSCDVKRIQFTVDLLPADILGLTIYRKDRGFELVKGPIFANFIIADEINRAPPKTQSALLEAMQERQVTIGKETFILPRPFFVMATKNPIEAAGTYSLPEAQIDRFLFKLFIDYPQTDEEKLIMRQNIELKEFDDFSINKVMSVKDIIDMQSLVKKIYISNEIENYIIRIVDFTRKSKTKYSKYIEWGASPRASISFFIASKARALMKGRSFVVPEDVKDVALDVLRHRIMLSYEAEADSITPDTLIKKIINEIPVP